MTEAAPSGTTGKAGSVEITPQEDLTARIQEWVGAKRLLIALDFDGTLAPFQDDPMAVSIVDGGAPVLAELAALEPVQLALVSGRRLVDLAGLATPPAGTVLAGSHGAERGHIAPSGELEVEAGGVTETESALLAEVTEALESIVASAEGTWVEEKTLVGSCTRARRRRRSPSARPRLRSPGRERWRASTRSTARAWSRSRCAR